MDVCRRLHDDPSVRALLWCLLSSSELDIKTLKESGFGDVESHAILKDEPGLLRAMKRRYALSQRLSVQNLAGLLRHKLSEHIERSQKATELSSILRCLKSLPDWLFPEWEQAALAKLAEKGLTALEGQPEQNAKAALATAS